MVPATMIAETTACVEYESTDRVVWVHIPLSIQICFVALCLVLLICTTIVTTLLYAILREAREFHTTVKTFTSLFANVNAPWGDRSNQKKMECVPLTLTP